MVVYSKNQEMAKKPETIDQLQASLPHTRPYMGIIARRISTHLEEQSLLSAEQKKMSPWK